MKLKDVIRANYQQSLFVFIAFFAMVLVSYFYASNIVRKQILDIGDISMDATQAAVSGGLTEAELVFSNTVQAVESMLSARLDNGKILDSLRNTNAYFNTEHSPLPDFMKIYGYIRGEFLDGSGWVPPAHYVPASRPWHIGAEDNEGRIFFSEPYLDAETGGLCISFSQKLFDSKGVAHGVLAIDLKLSRIADYVHKQKIAGNGYGVMIDESLNFVVHRNPELVGTNIAVAGGGYPGLARILAEKRTVSAERFIDADNTDSIIFFRPVFNDWYIGIVIPAASYYGQVYNLALVLGALGFVLMVVLNFMLIRVRVEKMRSEEESMSKSSFLARMSHEMRTPMNAVIGMAGIAQNSDDPERVRYCLGKISDASTHLLGVINDVLDMSKIGAGKLELSETDFPVNAMLRQVEAVAIYKIEEKRQRFSISVAPDVPSALVADRQRLTQVITNLVGNANKFTPEGGEIHLGITRLSDEGGSCVLRVEVTDNGIGMSSEQQSRLFNAFEQADGSISRKYGGTGLGLAISKRIVDLMGGTVWVESAPGNGSRFGFTFRAGTSAAEEPALAAAQANVSGQTGDEVRPFSGKRILLAEDVDLNREVLMALLEDTGVTFACADNGSVACEMFAAAPTAYDIIFMDIHMPDMDGYEATRVIRAMPAPEAKHIPIVAMTANVFREDIEKCLAAGMNGHVGKPLDLEEVLAAMKKYLA